LTFLKKFIIIYLQGKGSQRSQPQKNFKKVKKVLDKTKALQYNKDVRKKNKHQKKEGMYYD